MLSYSGFLPPKRWTPPVLDAAALTPETFFESYIVTRTPVILRGAFDPSLDASGWTTIPDVSVFVERRDAERLTYGTGVKIEMSTRELFERFSRGEDDLYLTTQPLPETPSGKPAALFGSPLSSMVGRFPHRPRLAGHLAPASVNLWIGASR